LFSRTWTPALYFSRAWRRCHVFLRLALVSFFSALGAVVMFSHTWGIVMFSRA